MRGGESLPANHVLTRKDVAFCRPATGLPPAQIDQLLGRKLAGGESRGGFEFGHGCEENCRMKIFDEVNGKISRKSSPSGNA